MDWDDAYSNSTYIPDGDAYEARWADLAASFRQTARARLDQRYGRTEREAYDLFLPDGEPRGAVVFVHGGYWHLFDKSSWSHLAAGPLAHGWAVAMPSYTLAPEARLGEIVRQIGAALTAISQAAPGELRLAGHSAGGHLVTRMVCANSPFSGPIAKTLSISGLHDLRPLMLTSMPLRLDDAEAMAESPALLRPRDGASVTAWVGADERPELLRQTALLAEAWGAKQVIAPGRHHFDVIEALADPDSAMIAELLDL